MLKQLGKTADIRKSPAFDKHEFVVFVHDQESGLEAFVAVHSTRLGFAHGGTRMKEYKTAQEALDDVLHLSSAMSYKSALANLPYGGAKGVIMLSGPVYDRKKLLAAYARKVQALNGLFRTGTDVGLTDADTAYMSRYCGYILGVGNGDRGGLSTSKAAALGAYHAIKEAARHRYGSDSLAGRRICIKGIGKLGGELARLVLNEGAELMVADIDDMKVANFLKEFPDATAISSADAHKQNVAIFAPCALGGELNAKTVKELGCDIVAGGANNQLDSEKTGDLLHARGILYAPDYVVNAGGLIFVSDELEEDGFEITRVLERLKAIRKTLRMIFERSRQEDIATHRIADRMAQERIARGRL